MATPVHGKVGRVLVSGGEIAGCDVAVGEDCLDGVCEWHGGDVVCVGDCVF